MTEPHMREFFAKVLPWPQEGEPPAYVNVHWTIDKISEKTGKHLWTGRAVRSVDEAVRTVQWALSLSDTRDLYFCTSTQREALPKKSRGGREYLLPIREQSNAVALKSLFIDLDAKGEGKNSYGSVPEAAAALSEFITKMDLPKPSALVTSGGGIHVYWTFDRALSLYEWQPLALALAEATKAHGLKCDTQCTVDGARILRVPGTFNRKLDTPRPVGLAGGRTGLDYAVDRLARALEPYKSVVAAPALPPRVPLKGVSDLAAGVDIGNAAPIDLNNVAKECAFIANAIATGGKDYTNPLWNLTTLISTFTVGGRADAHRLASSHPGYTPQSTDELYDRKERERQSKGLGWPACRTISASGAAACQACPHFGQNKSPLHFAAAQPVATLPAAPLVGGPNSSGSPSGSVGHAGGDLPPGYKRLATNVVCRILINADGTASEEAISSYPMYDPSIQVFPVYTLNFMTVTEAGRVTQISIPLKDAASKDSLRKVLWSQGLPLREHESKSAMEFFVSWIEKLQKTKSAVVSASPYGWSVDNKGNLEGFVFGGSLWMPSGDRAAAMPDPVLERRYRPTGGVEPWIEAAKLITNQRRPALDAIVASSFAAPLIRFCNEPGVLMSTYSQGSGIGKTTALKVAQAVWGNPIRAMQGLDDTENFIFGKVGQLQSLPMYWDELKTEEQHKRFVKLVFKLTSRKEKDRMTQSAVMRESGTWQTLLVSASNDSIMDHVIQQTKQTAAGVYRVFEYEVLPSTTGLGQIDQADASRIVGRLDDNYGEVGLEYARYLGRNHQTIEKDVADFYKSVGQEMKVVNEERYWRVMVACLLKGAEYSNKLGFTDIDLNALKEFLFGVVNQLRAARAKSPVDLTDDFNVTAVVGQYLTLQRARHTLWTNKIHAGRGKPPANSIKIVRDASRLEAIVAHVGVEDNILRLSSHFFQKWLRDEGYSTTIVMKALEKELSVREIRARMGAGTDLAGTAEYMLEIDLTNTPHLDFLTEA